MEQKQKNFCYKGNNLEEMIITEVSKPGREVLYDLNNPQHKNNALKLQIWKKIAMSVGITKDECQKAWRSLKTKYKTARIMKETPTGTLKKKKLKPYTEWLLKEMQFIEQYMRDVKPTYNSLHIREMPLQIINDSENDDGYFVEDLDYTTSSTLNNGCSSAIQRKENIDSTDKLDLCFGKLESLEKNFEQRNEEDVFGIFISKEVSKVAVAKQNELKIKLMELVFDYQKSF